MYSLHGWSASSASHPEFGPPSAGAGQGSKSFRVGHVPIFHASHWVVNIQNKHPSVSICRIYVLDEISFSYIVRIGKSLALTRNGGRRRRAVFHVVATFNTLRRRRRRRRREPTSVLVLPCPRLDSSQLDFCLRLFKLTTFRIICLLNGEFFLPRLAVHVAQLAAQGPLLLTTLLKCGGVLTRTCGKSGATSESPIQFYGPLTVTGAIIRRDARGEPAAYELELPRQWRVHRWFAEEKLKLLYAVDPQKRPSMAGEEVPPTLQGGDL